MKFINYLLICSALVLTGCTSKPTVFVYAKYLDNAQREELKKTFEQTEKYHIEINEFDFPVTITHNTLLYSLLLQEPATIDLASELSASAGFPIERTEGLAKGNHWYTKNSLALFLLPENKGSNVIVFQQDLVNDYKGKNCDEAVSLTLDKDGTFFLSTKSDDKGIAGDSVMGIWKYRQYPFLELQRKGVTYSEYYFEIKTFRDSDNVSEIDFVELVSLNPGSLPQGCYFLVGTRV